MKRRTLVHVAVAAPLAGFIHRHTFPDAEARPLPSGVDPHPQGGAAVPRKDTPVMQWFGRWLDVTARMRALPAGSPAFDGLLDEQTSIEDSLLTLPAENARDFVAKVYAYTNRGEGGLPSHNELPALWAEARALMFDTRCIVHAQAHPQEDRT